MDQSCQKMLSVLRKFGIQTSTSSTNLFRFFFYQGVILGSFKLEANCLILSISKKIFTSELELL